MLSHDGLAVNGLAVNGLAVNGLAVNGLAITSLALLLFTPIILLGADYLFDEALKVKAGLKNAPHYRAFLYLSVIALSLIVILASQGSYSYFDTFRVTGESLIWVFATALLAFFFGKSILKQSWSSRERERIERLDLELPQYLEMFYILITSGMSVLSALRVLSQGSSSLGDEVGTGTALVLVGSSGSHAREVSGRDSLIREHQIKAGTRSSVSSIPLNQGRSEMKAVVSEILRGVEEGLSIERALDNAVMRAGSEQLRRFGDAVILGMERGSSMGQTLRNLINETRTQSKVLVMQRAGKAEIKLLIPVVFLILPISVIFAIWPSYVNLASIMGG